MKNWFAAFLVFVTLFTGYTQANAEEDRDCPQFSSGEEVANFWVSNGYSATNDPHRLDADGDGLPCETSQADLDQAAATLNSNDDSDNSDTEMNTSTNASEGEEMPDTATNNMTMIGFGVALLLAGSVLVFRKKETN
ncbi:excalibur calcium-binding domain-containing protein [Bacillus sp. V5-8f]|uniref:excalibur calcium-binding domain-containing protein n=1 Tax=Bacillus sp. V5-8f TaxID=2053044 RepID=UPI000C788520|nr:excalibur calcium-binding domain-containing protein [Bacillus sp. V5-8f]PLT33092.1 cell surface protein [Bacillus sp. V5-8f]